LCVSCHNPASPTYKPFNILAFSRDIQHWPDLDKKAYLKYAEECAREREKAAQAKAAVEMQEAARAGSGLRMAEEQAKAVQATREAQAVLEHQKDEAKAEVKQQNKMAAAVRATAEKTTGVERHLAGLADIFTLNPNGEKYQTVRFTHSAHASKDYVV